VFLAFRELLHSSFGDFLTSAGSTLDLPDSMLPASTISEIINLASTIVDTMRAQWTWRGSRVFLSPREPLCPSFSDSLTSAGATIHSPDFPMIPENWISDLVVPDFSLSDIHGTMDLLLPDLSTGAEELALPWLLYVLVLTSGVSFTADAFTLSLLGTSQ
jgi:hypothetical protein